MVLFHCLTVPIAESKIGLIQYPTSPTRAKILSLRSSSRYSLPRSFLKELSLEQLDYLRMHIIYKNRHRKQLYGVQSSGLMVRRQMAVNWLKSLKKYRQCDVQAQSSSRAKGQKGSHFCFVVQRYWSLEAESHHSTQIQISVNVWLALTHPTAIANDNRLSQYPAKTVSQKWESERLISHILSNRAAR